MFVTPAPFFLYSSFTFTSFLLLFFSSLLPYILFISLPSSPTVAATYPSGDKKWPLHLSLRHSIRSGTGLPTQRQSTGARTITPSATTSQSTSIFPRSHHAVERISPQYFTRPSTLNSHLTLVFYYSLQLDSGTAPRA